MFTRYLSIVVAFFLVHNCHAQQFVGLTSNTYSAIQQMPYNPAWVNNSENGTEINLFGASILAGNNAYAIAKAYASDGGSGTKGVDYFKDRTENRKHFWQNLDILGPAVSFKYKDKHHIGVYTRMRELVRAGHMPYGVFRLVGEDSLPQTAFYTPFDLSCTGVSIHSFAEVGISYGQVLKNDDYHVVKGGVTVKYLMGFSAASIYADNFDMTLRNGDTLLAARGDVTALYSYNINPYVNSKPFSNAMSFMERAGKGGLGLDLGLQYEYHPDGTPNYETPYKYSIAVSLTDLGGITYLADSGSGSYEFAANDRNFGSLRKTGDEELGPYLDRIVKDSLLTRKESVEKFSMGLPSALRINTDWVANQNFNVAVNVLLNLKGNGGNTYRPAYVSYLNITPTYGNRKYAVSIPMTVYGRQTLTLGASLRYGPFYIGSSSLFSTVMGKNLRNADFYMGLMLKLKKDKFII